MSDAVSKRARARRTVSSALQNHAWIWDISGALTVPVLTQYLELRERLQDQALDPNTPDAFVWRWEPSGVFSIHSAYAAMSLGAGAVLAPRRQGAMENEGTEQV
jgi:hypothetical protein